MERLDITLVPCLRDNYAYILRCGETGAVAVVDPSVDVPVCDALDEAGLTPEAVLCTHHHGDHVGGVPGLLRRWPDLAVHGHASDRGRIRGQTVFHEDGDTFRLGTVELRVRHIPGHTRGAVAYAGAGEVFTGDTLFQAGCGRLFEGTPEMMYRSLNETLMSLPGETRVWCGHEYTVANLRYALHAEPDNAAARERLAWAEAERAAGRPTLPSTLDDERGFNPFVRAGSVEELARRRAEKDVF
ncbi:MAG: hydroxyacylglutathione hydrolase [Deltaproteobacteria bacterium]|nr:hydroxyacylglutathione hydrolase [Deltaproteobacteria bacterium]MCB9785668.1 hydroxyacylglutathione hydrolase [Deltaproteobacteria bacterium]